jgi:hypothetical protein
MVHSETEVTELEAESFQVMERLNAGVNVDLFSKEVISVVGDQHHRHQVIAGVTRNLFRATTIYYDHIIFFSCRVRKWQVNDYRTR